MTTVHMATRDCLSNKHMLIQQCHVSLFFIMIYFTQNNHETLDYINRIIYLIRDVDSVEAFFRHEADAAC